MRHTDSSKLLLALAIHTTLLVLCLSLRGASCYSTNIKIQVNNENHQRAPYLLEAIKRVTESEQAESAAAAAAAAAAVVVGSKKDAAMAASSEQAHDGHAGYKGVDEEALEEELDLQPESVLRLAPSNLVGEIATQERAKLPDMVASASHDDRHTSLVGESGGGSSRGPAHSQLSITSSHLKRPSVSLRDDESDKLQIVSSSNQGDLNKRLIASSQATPSVAAAEDESTVEKKAGQVPPDTWEAGQVMSGVTNASLVPATVRREYGQHSRTRITVGGGYVRDKLPPIGGEPAPSAPQSAIDESKRAKFNQQLAAAAKEQAEDTSRVIEVPERIVVPDSIFQDQQSVKLQPVANKISIATSTAASNTTQFKERLDSRCPQRGSITLEHPTACDKYFLCQNGYLAEKTCPNGLLYGTRDLVKDSCVHRWQVVCGDKSMPNPISTPGCRWQYGIFNVQGSPKCSPDFYECIEGSFQVKKCPLSGQVYDDRTKSCQYAERVGCADQVLSDFQCPPDDQGNTYWPFPRYFLNDRALIHCVNDKPAIVRCRDDERVDPEHLHCVLKSAASDSAPALESTGDGLLARNSREKKKKAERSFV